MLYLHRFIREVTVRIALGHFSGTKHTWIAPLLGVQVAEGEILVRTPRKILPRGRYFLKIGLLPFHLVQGCLPDVLVWTGMRQTIWATPRLGGMAT